MSKARKAALDWLPKLKDGRKRGYQCDDDDIRSIYAKGYRKAEKDLELSWEEIYSILYFEREVLREFGKVELNSIELCGRYIFQ